MSNRVGDAKYAWETEAQYECRKRIEPEQLALIDAFQIGLIPYGKFYDRMTELSTELRKGLQA